MKSSCSECGAADVPNHLKTVKRPLTVDHTAVWLLYDAGHVCIELPNEKYADEIRLAVNAYPALVEALKRSKPILDWALEWENRSQYPSAIVAQNLKLALGAIEAALKLAESK